VQTLEKAIPTCDEKKNRWKIFHIQYNIEKGTDAKIKGFFLFIKKEVIPFFGILHHISLNLSFFLTVNLPHAVLSDRSVEYIV
jgi:hypothetical protein